MHDKPQGQSLDSRVQELSILFEISQILDRSIDLKQSINPILQSLAEHLQILRGTITLLNRQTGEIFIEEAYGLSNSQQEKGRYQLGEGITGKVVQTGQSVVVPRISDEPAFLNKTGARKGMRKRDISFICVPVKIGNETIGAFSADRPYEEEGHLDRYVQLFSIVASMIAQAVKIRQSLQEERQKLMEENSRLKHELQEKFRPANIIGSSPTMQAVFDLIAQVCKSEATVLIRGESGTGKELVAHAIHYNSYRAQGPFIKVNCAALPETVIESELFGHEKGAFTGAINTRKGRFEMADGGTIFLDEIGDLAPMTQVKLLRVLQEQEFERVGGNKTIRTNVRIIAATNRNLEEAMITHDFREDLYYRLNVFPIHIPPLRDRRTDIMLLTDYFVEKYASKNHKAIRRISTSAIDLLTSYHWPGNVRELENCIERAVLMSSDEVIHAHHLPPSLQSAESTGTSFSGTLAETLDNMEREIILDSLKTSRGNMAKSARALGITERIMGLRVKKHGIDPSYYK
ncbi:nif-specific transcriptional activator NifA [Spirochaeta cellobiosiphila]|uniref:nif-specific transcriptional activator NifA n=1 Tax=Spirochaeta cellobiosiphila TaxID=504483 RepID=UPI0004033832|nr:nif-specific transcriptional activator NifA [Spirochaeta cellobiosiphila]